MFAAVAGPVGTIVSGVARAFSVLGPWVRFLAIVIRSTAVPAIWSMTAALLANPITWVVLAVVALVAAIVLIAKKTTWFQTAWKAMCSFVSAAWKWLWNAIKAAAMFVLKLIVAYITVWKTIILAIWNAIKVAAVAVWNGIKAAVQFVIDAIRLYIQMWATIITAIWNGIKAAAVAVWNGIQIAVQVVVTVIQAIITALGNVITAIWNGIKAVATAVWNGIQSAVQTVADVIRSAISTAVDTVINIFNRVKSIGETVWNGIKGFIDGVGNAIQTVIGFVQGLIDKMQSAADFASKLNPANWFEDAGLGMVVNMVPANSYSSSGSRLNLAAGYPTLSGLGALGPNGGGIVQNIDARTIVKVDGSGVSDPQQVANAVAGATGRDRRTRGLDFAVRVGA